MEVGEAWLYQPTKFDAIHCAEILKIGKTVKVKIRKPDWLTGKFDVERDQIHVPWDDRDAFEASVKPFMDLADMSGPEEEEWNAVEIVLVATGLDNYINFHVYGCAETYDASLVARACRVSLATLVKEQGTVVDGDYVAFPWKTMLRLARALARTRFDIVLDYIRDDAAFWDERAVENATSPHAGVSAAEYDRLKAIYNKMFDPGYNLVRKWCGSRRASQRDELIALQTKYERLLGLAAQASRHLAKTRQNALLAEDIQRLVAVDRKPGRA